MARGDSNSDGMFGGAKDAVDLVKEYAKQETVGPLKGLGRYIGFGVGGSVVLGIAAVLLVLAGLRALQTETGSTFTGNLSWIPYLIMVVVAVILIAILMRALTGPKADSSD